MANTLRMDSVTEKLMGEDLFRSLEEINQILGNENIEREPLKGRHTDADYQREDLSPEESRRFVGGESRIFWLVRDCDRMRFIGKQYDVSYSSKSIKWEKVRNRVLEFLYAQTSRVESHLLLPEDDIVVTSSHYKDEIKTYYDVIPYCESGSLKNRQLSYKELREHFLPNMLTALDKMHAAGFIHGDIKPDNLYMLGKEYLLGDFGTVRVEGEEEEYVGTQTMRGTLGFRAPEIMEKYAKYASDYYSLGCCLITLYLGRHPFQELIDNGNEVSMNHEISNRGYVIPVLSTDSEEVRREKNDLQNLVTALTMESPKDRPSSDEIRAWIENPNDFRRRERIGNNGFCYHFPVEGKVCTSLEQLVDSMANNWHEAKRHLVTLSRYLANFVQTLAADLDGICQECGNPIDDLCMAKAMHILSKNNNAPVYWRGKIFRNLGEISTGIAQKEFSFEDVRDLLQCGFLSWKYKMLGAPEKEVERIQELESLAHTNPSLAFYCAKYEFTNDEKIVQFLRRHEIDEVFHDLMEDVKLFYMNADKFIYSEELMAFIIKKGHKNSALLHLEKKHTDRKYMLNDFFVLMYACCKDKRSVSKKYMDCGPYSYAFWVKNHLDLYEAHTDKGESILKGIANVPVQDSLSISEIQEMSKTISSYIEDMRKEGETHFQGNVLLTYLGIKPKDEYDISSKHSDAFFTEDFLGESVPLGYIRDMGLLD